MDLSEELEEIKKLSVDEGFLLVLMLVENGSYDDLYEGGCKSLI